MTTTINDLSDDELLREALIDLELLRKREEESRKETESLLYTLRLLTSAESTEAMFYHLMNVLKQEIGFEEAMVLREDVQGNLLCDVSTVNAFEHTNWVAQKLFKRVLDGESLALFDIGMVPEWKAQHESVRDGFSSALLASVRLPTERGMLIGLHHERGIFANDSVQKVKRFIPLIEQAMVNAHSRKAAELHKKLEHEKEMAVRSAHMKDQFLSTMSHELRTPMNGILGFTELLLTDPDTEPRGAQGDYLQEVRKAAEHLLHLINQILDIGRIDSGRIELVIEKVELNRFAWECHSMLDAHAEKFQVAVTVVEHAVPVTIETDHLRLRQIVINLVNNAVKYNRPGGHVRIEIDGDDKQALIRIIDDGIGMTPSQVLTIFEPFTRVSNTQSEVEGTGIGLTIVAKLLRLLGGNVEVESELGKGSCFTVTLPKQLQLNK